MKAQCVPLNVKSRHPGDRTRPPIRSAQSSLLVQSDSHAPVRCAAARSWQTADISIGVITDCSDFV
jgi:hypothetical protein